MLVWEKSRNGIAGDKHTAEIAPGLTIRVLQHLVGGIAFVEVFGVQLKEDGCNVTFWELDEAKERARKEAQQLLTSALETLR